MASPALPAALANRLRYRHLMLLHQLGELGNLHRAAEAISLAQPSASKMLRDIELAFGFPLFERSARGMGITELGRHVVEFAGSALVDFERFVADLEAKRRGGFGQLVVGGIMGAAPDVVARAVADLKKKRPLLAVRILGETSDQLLDLLQRRELDLAVGRFSAPMQHNRFDFEPLANELLCAVVRKGHPLCRARALTLADLVDWPWVLQLLSSPARQLMEDEFAQANLRTPREPGRVRLDLRDAAVAAVERRGRRAAGIGGARLARHRAAPPPADRGGRQALRLRRADPQVGAARPGRARAGGPDAHLRGAHDEAEPGQPEAGAPGDGRQCRIL